MKLVTSAPFASLAALALVQGCVAEEPEGEISIATDSRAPDEGAAELVVLIVTPDGEPARGDRFATKSAVFMITEVVGTNPTQIRTRELYFRVVDGEGSELSTSPLACRKIQVGTRGRIEQVPTGTAEGRACMHHVTGEPSSDQVAVGLAPFEDAAIGRDGLAAYSVELVPAERFEGFRYPAYVLSFVIAP